jgi:hypothetical protein
LDASEHRFGDKFARGIGVLTPSLEANSDFTLICFNFVILPLFFKLKTEFAPVPLQELNGVNLNVK